MTHRNSALIIVLLSSFFSACTTAHYRPLTSRPTGNWQGSSLHWGGYTETRKSQNNYQIGFESYNFPGPEAVSYFSLVRAAERSAIDGKKKFYLEPSKVRTYHNVSHFAGYTIPGYCLTHLENIEKILPCGETVYIQQKVITHVPDRFEPPRDAYNSIFKISRKLSYTHRLSKPYNTYQILSDASRNTHGFGRPKISSVAHAQMKTWAETNN
ncbi:MAG: hypothetical protein ABGY95_11930 [Rubritalea sp.]|uniref:hypothetical protein n=1 Tax=Rubritalea sp. TaxID=2109375 RepID=UPI003241D87D